MDFDPRIQGKDGEQSLVLLLMTRPFVLSESNFIKGKREENDESVPHGQTKQSLFSHCLSHKFRCLHEAGEKRNDSIIPSPKTRNEGKQKGDTGSEIGEEDGVRNRHSGALKEP